MNKKRFVMCALEANNKKSLRETETHLQSTEFFKKYQTTMLPKYFSMKKIQKSVKIQKTIK